MSEPLGQRHPWALLGLLTLALACRAAPRQPPHESVGDGAATLRAAFNADVGKVRVLLLVHAFPHVLGLTGDAPPFPELDPAVLAAQLAGLLRR